MSKFLFLTFLTMPCFAQNSISTSNTSFLGILIASIILAIGVGAFIIALNEFRDLDDI